MRTIFGGIAARDEEIYLDKKNEQQNHGAFEDQNAAAKKENAAEAKCDEDCDDGWFQVTPVFMKYE